MCIRDSHNAGQKGEELPLSDLAASFQKAVVDVLCDRVMKAAGDTGAKRIVLAGGVSANSRLRSEMQKLCEQKGLPLFLPPLNLCGDNAAMVGSQGYYEYLAGHLAGPDLNATANMSIDQIKIGRLA